MIMESIIKKLEDKADEQGYLPYPYAIIVDGNWFEGLISIDYLKDYLKDFQTLEVAINETKSKGLKLLLEDYKLLK